jgi:ribonuclease E
LRHKVTILLIPNVHLETPAHTITRLRHDDLNQDDLREPSYKMVDMPIEEAIKQATQAEAAKPRQEAAIKGISPDQPAPIMPEKAEAPVATPAQPETGLFSKIFSWFRSSPKPVEPVAAPEPAKKPREGRGDGRRDGRRGGRNGNRRDEERGERKERPERKDRNAVDKVPQEGTPVPNGERKERRPRGERKERGERQQPENVESKLIEQSAATDVAVAPLLGNDAPDAQGNEEQGNRRRGRRGGRGRGERRNEAETTAPVAEALTEMEPVVESINQEPVVVVIPAVEPVAAVTDIAVPAVEQLATIVTEVAPVAEVLEALSVPVEIAETHMVEVQATPKLEVATQVVVEPVNLEATLAESGLVLVQTTSAAVAVAQAEPPVKLGRPRKAKPAAEQAESETLVMVETAK